MATLSLAQVEELVAKALMRCRTRADNARSVAKALVLAEADGLLGHGLSRVTSYCAQAKAGKVDGFVVPAVTRTKPGIAGIDAKYGFAYPALDAAIEILPRITAETGIAAAGIRRSHHCGAAGHPAERLARQGLVALLFANTPAAIAPAGGKRGLFGTNPIAFACPLPGADPIIIDVSLSKVARGNILAAKQRDELIPEGWALDKDGKPTTDPDAALSGTMLPLGDAKGTVLALMVELLAAGLTDANYAAEASSFLDAKGGPPGTGQLIITIDPNNWGEGVQRFAALARAIENETGARLAGARRLAARKRAQENGLLVSDMRIAEISALH
ncbi:MAG TPA: Ldh family oxidoreductase [Micropepsaceae bacterium]|nr:Ldh family oxidoreductase [Micropepsaceae bacterium]